MIGVTAAIITQGQTVMLARRKSGKHLEGFWELPGGKIEPNESLEECLKREFQEEFGAQLSVHDHFNDSVYDYGDLQVKLMGFMCELVSPILFMSEHDDWKFIPQDELTLDKMSPV